MSSLKIRILLAAFFAAPAFTLGSTLAQAQEDGPPPAPAAGYAGAEVCKACHAEYYEAWKDSPHANAATTDAFQQQWAATGSPAYCLSCHTTGYDSKTGEYHQGGVTCENCHGEFQPGHPATPMEVNPKTEACQNCHTETYREWKLSGHARADIACTACHNVHSPGLKAANSTQLCAVCHTARAQDFSHAPHSSADLTCSDCHIGLPSGPLEEGKRITGHTFVVNTDVCADCHRDQIHRAAAEDASAVEPTPAPVNEMGLTPAPNPVSPFGYGLLAGVAGVGVGIVLAPWLEKFFRGRKEE